MIFSKEIILHVGTEKSGSTYIQEKYFSNLKNICYISRPSEDNIIWESLKIIINNNPQDYNLKSIKEQVYEYIENNIIEKKILISWEDIFGIMYNGFFSNKQITEAVHFIFPQAKIFLVIRRQDTFIESIYKHIIKAGYSISLESYINYNKGDFFTNNIIYNGLPSANINNFCYLNYINFYYDLFGKENVFVLPFEMLKQNEKRFISLIFDRFKLELNSVKEKKINQDIKNKGLSFISYYLFRVFNRFIYNKYNTMGFIVEKPFFNYLKKYKNKNNVFYFLYKISNNFTFKNLVLLIEKIYYKKVNVMPQELKNDILSYHKKSNKNLSDLINIDLKEYGYYDN